MTQADQLLDDATVNLTDFIENMLTSLDAEEAEAQARDLLIAIAAYTIQVHIEANP